MALPLLLAAAVLLGGVVGGLLGFLAGRRSEGANRRSASDEETGFRRKIAELTRELQQLTEERSRDVAVATMIPVIVRNLGAAQSAPAIPCVVVRVVKSFFRATQVGFFAPRKSDGAMVLVEGAGFPKDWRGTRGFSASEGMLGAAAQERIVVTSDEYLAGMREMPLHPTTLEAAGVRPEIVIPVSWGETFYGMITVAGSAFPAGKERPYASMLGDLTAWAIRNMSAVASADLQASTDHLTGIPNRALFASRFEIELRQARNYAQPISLLVFDIDHFKKVNDTCGHQAGDVVLKRVAEMIRSTTRGSDLVARYGGEEFVVLMTSSGKEQAVKNANRIRELVASTPFPIPGHDAPLRIAISGGVATFPEDGESTAELIRAADEALYAAKEQGRNRIVAAARIGLDGKPY